MSIFSGLQPERVLHYFEVLSGIQCGSGHEKPVSDYLRSFAESRGFEVYQDEVYNILIKAPGTAEGKNAQPIILHGHMDIVWKKEDGSKHDFFKDPLDLYIEDGYIKARGTTLGADNGIGVAYMLALMESDDIPHPPFECIITVMEEMGKRGAAVYDTSTITAKRMIDFNWIDDKQILVGCSGDASYKVTLPLTHTSIPDNQQLICISLAGLAGGHCEFDIHLERGNSILLLARVLYSLKKEVPYSLVEIEGGVQNNVIPSEAKAIISIAPSDKAKVEASIRVLADTLATEYRVAEPSLSLVAKEVAGRKNPMALRDDVASALLEMLMLFPYGVISMSREVEGNVECSANLGILRQEDSAAWMITTITSAVTSRKHVLAERLDILARRFGAACELYGVDAPEFCYNPDSGLLKITEEAYLEAMGQKAIRQISVASLQLGLFIQALHVDTIGIGTEIYDTHNPKERMNLQSIDRVWKMILVLMKKLCSA